MIRALQAITREPRFRQCVGLVVLIAFVLAVAVGAAHVGERMGEGHDDCSACDAASAAFSSEVLLVPDFLPPPDVVRKSAECGVLAPRAFEPRRSHAPRGPPAGAAV